MSASALYIGNVEHRRHGARDHRLKYRVFSMLVDLDELEALDSNLRLFSYNRAGLFSIFDRDHGEGDGGDLRSDVRTKLEQAGLHEADGPIRMLCYPRILGYVFNPLTTYFCYGRGGKLRAMMYEVSNTHGERHTYVIPVNDAARLVRQACRKEFFVSPFLPMDCEYHFSVRQPAERVSVTIRQTRLGNAVLDAWFIGRMIPLTDANLARVAVHMPLMTLKVIVGIHWEAFKLWRKGLPLYHHSAAPANGISVVTNERN